jgi:hypothetical protein
MPARHHPDVLPPAGPGALLAGGAKGPLYGRRAAAVATPDHHNGRAGRGWFGLLSWLGVVSWFGVFGWRLRDVFGWRLGCGFGRSRPDSLG